MKEVPVNNVEPVIVDIKHPNFNYSRLNRLATITSTEIKNTSRKSSWKRVLMLVSGALGTAVILGVALVVWTLYSAKSMAESRGRTISNNLLQSIESFKSLDSKTASRLLGENKKELDSLGKIIKNPPQELLLGSIADNVPVIKDSIQLFNRLNSFNSNFLVLSDIVEDLKHNGFKYFTSNGVFLIQRLRETQDLLKNLNEEITNIQNLSAKLSASSPFFKEISESVGKNYIKYSSNIYIAENALDSLISLLDTKIDKHIVLFFNNAGELRPGGGFIGSYGDLVLNNGQMVSLEVQNIYWPDRPFNLELKIVPPDPLQTITNDWGARDANWFFDYPTSAKTVLGFLEASKIYKEKNISFEGALAVNTYVFQSLLRAVGPIPVPEYDMVLDENNFLDELQEEVEAGKDKKAGDNPKKVLGVIAPVLIEKLQDLPETSKAALAKVIEDHVSKKDIMVYMKDSKISAALNTAGVDGSVLALPHNFWGNYLAVVNGNIAGGKTDVLTIQNIKGRIDVASDGSSFVDLDITRANNGGNKKDWWWNSDNQNYIQIFTNDTARIVALDGNTVKKRKERLNYENLGYLKNQNLENLENSAAAIPDLNAWKLSAWGKNIFATWFTVPAGKTKALKLRYQIPGSPNFSLSVNKIYTFAFERQSGSKTSLEMDIAAPLGYIWQESGDNLFQLKTLDPKAREIITLHLVENNISR